MCCQTILQNDRNAREKPSEMLEEMLANSLLFRNNIGDTSVHFVLLFIWHDCIYYGDISNMVGSHERGALLHG